ncbi:MAG: aldehyde dehydrogenase family protein, partial [Magnetovibrio sp.]|nr:aldehyde dehydrogenase family protein [Magnetovibrio sp.]
PWNYPVLQASKKLAGLLGAGCACVLKPAEETPSATIALVKTLLDAGLPERTINVVFGVPAEVSSFLIADPAIRKITFTGSVPVGKLLARQAGDHMKPVTMELGGHSPVIVFDDVDATDTADLLAARKFNNTGQVCVSPTRFFIQRPSYETFVERFCEQAEAVKVGNGFDDGVTMGPLANDRRLQAIQDLVADAVDRGATLRTGGKRIGNKGYFFEPTVLTEVALDSDLMTIEPFGPVVPILPFDDEDEVLELANATDYGLSGYFFTQDAERQRKFAAELEVGTIGINDTPIHVAEIPLGGWKDSGYGVEGGIEMLGAYLKSKFVYTARD